MPSFPHACCGPKLGEGQLEQRHPIGAAHGHQGFWVFWPKQNNLAMLAETTQISLLALIPASFSLEFSEFY